MIQINIKPMSLGRAWSQARSGRRFLVKEAKDYKKFVASKCKSLASLSGYRGALSCEIDYHGPWLTKKGSISKTAGDIDNFSKLLIDALCEAYDFDDSQIIQMNLRKVITDDWKILLSIEKTEL